ncbi:MAG: cupin domain-containing protein [Pseudomonadota bacterium]
MKTAYRDIRPFTTKDGSQIRELMHPAVDCNRQQSLAEAATATSPMSGRTSEASRASLSSRGPRLGSIAEAIVVPGALTRLHRHRSNEEIYHFTAGSGHMTLGAEATSATSRSRGPRLDPIAEEFPVTTGDTVCIPPGTSHRLHNTGHEPLRLLCSCSPPYSDEDTELL